MSAHVFPCVKCWHVDFDHKSPNGTTVSGGCLRCSCTSFVEATVQQVQIRDRTREHFALMQSRYRAHNLTGGPR